MRCEDYIQFVKKVPFLNSTDLVVGILKNVVKGGE